MRAYSVRNNNQILPGDQTRCEENIFFLFYYAVVLGGMKDYQHSVADVSVDDVDRG